MTKPNWLNNVIRLKPRGRTSINAQLYIDKSLVLKRLSPDLGDLVGIRETDVGRPVSSLMTNLKKETLAGDALNVITSGDVINREVETVAGKWYQVITLPAVRQTDGEIEGAIIVFSDITEKKLDVIRMSDFIAMVSHELKTPLTSVQGYVQIVMARARSAKDAFAAGALDKANIQLKKMNALINGFLNVAQLDAGKIHLDKSPFEINTLIAEIVEETMLADPARNIESSPCFPTTLLADKEKIAQVIGNLLGNAIKYSAHGSRVNIGCQVDPLAIQVVVTDCGRGISPKDREKLFDRYYRVDNVTGESISGFGLGLYLSAEIIKRHQGEIWVESEVGKGSAFYFKLPRL
ncbi:sensor histidine kinase [Hufsiella ginkgonis]|uniref:histidine kinase n=1 Tax=Hufsiella ginkgonis TaxID=2695274 RepID=A0A7K1Y0L6_9SPHI|nr:ATP-binding protein [Hufsiella ginkgonis]MXV16628.1 hypothetical protein [Hufsiella ginkgonis]